MTTNISGLNSQQIQVQTQVSSNQRHTVRQGTATDKYWAKEKKKNTGLIERLYNIIKNATGLGIGSKNVEAKLKQANNGEISAQEFKDTVKKYNASQEFSAQALGDLISVGVAGLTYFGLRNDAKLHYSGKLLNEKFGSKNELKEMAETAGGGLNMKTMKKIYSKLLAKVAKSKTKLALFMTGIAAMMGGFAKLYTLQINRICSQEFNTNKKDFHGAKTAHDKAEYKIHKKMNSSAKNNSNFRNFASGAINGLLMPISVLGGALVGIPVYFLGNSLNRHFIGSRHSDKSVSGYAESFVNDGVSQAALAAATLIPMAKKGRFSATFDKNLEKAFNEINAHSVLKDNPYQGKSAFQEVSDILFESPKVSEILKGKAAEKGKTLSWDEQIKALSDENIFAVKLKQIQSGDGLSKALQENCPATRTITEATEEIQSKLGKNYKVKVNMGTGTIAETYLAEAPDGKEICVKMLKKGINAEKINRDKQKFIDIIKGLEGKSDAEKRYLIKNVENLAESVSKEIDFKNEMEAAKKLVNYTKTAKVVKPIMVKDGLYVMEKADGISLKKLLDLNRADSYINVCERNLKDAKKPQEKEFYQQQIDHYKKIKSDLTKNKNIILTEKDADYLIDEYMKVLIEQLYKTDNAGRTLHADIHPGNIFIDVEALKARKGKPFTLIDTGNTLNLSAEQAQRSMRLTQYIEHGDTKDLAKYFIEDADLSASKLTRDEAEKVVEKALSEVFFNSDVRLNTMNNTEIINLTSNIMKKHNIMPGDSQFSLNKARTSAEQSYISLLEIWFKEALQNSSQHKNQTVLFGSVMKKLGKLIKKVNEYKELQQIQERENTLNLIKSPGKWFKSQLNPNYKEPNSKEYLIYHLKQDIKQDDKMFS